MYKGQYVFSQLVSMLPRREFDACVERYRGNYRVKGLTCWIQFLAMAFGQITDRESLRDTVTCLRAHDSKLYHLGFNHPVTRSTLAEANENRDWRIYADFAQILIPRARQLYLNDNDFSIDINNTVYALDSTTIDLCLSVFWWAPFRRRKAAVKLNTLLDLRGDIPTFISITHGKTHEINTLDEILFEPSAFYIMDKGFFDLARLFTINRKDAFFVIRAKANTKMARIYSAHVDKNTGLRCDQTVRFTIPKAVKDYPEKIRRVKYFDKENSQTYVFLTNNFDIAPLEVAQLYKYRWKIELFFKWIKQHLRIKSFWGYSQNAVKTQIWIAICSYLTIAIAKKELGIDRNLYEILQILSVSAFDKTPLFQLLNDTNLQILNNPTPNQLTLFNL